MDFMANPGFCPNCFVEGVGEYCGYCGYNALSQADSHQLLPPGVVLKGRYLVGRTLGAGGFGITYLVKDITTRKLCAVKEYLPTVLAVRDATSGNIRPSSTDNEDTFRHGLSMFHREAQMLRKFAGNPSIVQVYDDFEANGTAYFVMEYLDGVTLKTLMRSMGGRLPVDLAVEVLQNMTTILAEVHKQGMLHRDISPDNIFVTKSGDTKLIDFGATRFYVGERSQSLSVILKPGFAPPEQYSSRGKQGPWTDLYALCATFYNTCTGTNVPDAPDRLAGETIAPLSMVVPGVPPQLAAAIERGLSLDWRMRQQGMEELYQSIHAGPAGQSLPVQPQQSHISEQISIHGAPFIQIIRGGQPQDKWLIPKNIKVSIGRSPQQCNIVADMPNVSRLHCTVLYDEKSGFFHLSDCSTNGTWTGGGRLGNGQTVALSPGDTFYISSPENTMMVGLE